MFSRRHGSSRISRNLSVRSDAIFLGNVFFTYTLVHCCTNQPKYSQTYPSQDLLHQVLYFLVTVLSLTVQLPQNLTEISKPLQLVTCGHFSFSSTVRLKIERAAQSACAQLQHSVDNNFLKIVSSAAGKRRLQRVNYCKARIYIEYQTNQLTFICNN